ncbi:MAG: hypothetical protein DRQ52_03150 [Gammaproteobacteria bacterium]|nr:MAG: hypothetical protein DRQ52_03150 [Gammaproteobacteria bacterium]RLA51559.1 MAG: hypothetical protein DRR42_10065 [Gammaproteobacteria bacterium]
MQIKNRQALPGKQKGSILVLTGISLFMLVGFAALALDSSILLVARNELQNGADAGALAGTRVLYLNSGTSVNAGANQVAFDTATSNISQTTAVESNWVGGSNNGDVQRGHWSFATNQFTPNPSLLTVSLWNTTTAELDANVNFINAVRVTTRREATPVQALFARIWGVDSTEMSATAVAYIGFAGSLQPEEVDQPLAICGDSIVDSGGNYSCNVGRMIPEGDQTGGWTNFVQESSCTGPAAPPPTVKPLICATGNPDMLNFGADMNTNNGQNQPDFVDLESCWVGKTDRTEPWNITLPVINCDGNIAPCNELIGAVNVNVIWIQNKAQSAHIDNPGMAPSSMDCDDCPQGSWTAPLDPSGNPVGGIQRWDSFVDHFQLKNSDGSSATYASGGWRQKTVYFLPDCTPHEPSGTTGGENFGILAKIPVLVQ